MSDQKHTYVITRREALKLGLLGATGLTIVERFGGYARGEDANLPPANKKAPAKAVIELWMSGGPTHLDTFDPKPQAGNDYCGPFKTPIATNVDGIQICELLPQLAKQADKYSIIRSMTHGINAHETATYIMKTGRKPGNDNLVFPGMGAVVSLFKGYDHGYKGLIPPYIVLTATEGRFSEEGFLGPRYKPFATGGDPAQKRFVVSGVVAEGVSDQRQKSRRELLHSLDSLGKAMPGNPQFGQLDQCEEKAYNLILGDGGKVFDMSNEKDELKDKYGKNKFGQSCLMARRLVEIGVPYITVNYGGWDTHKQNFEMRRKLPELDKGMAALLADLSDRGLLDSTIVVWAGEFGRTPKIQWESPWNGGRGHYGNCFSAVVAGGGFKGGHIVGTSDDKGEEVARRPVLAADLIGSMYELLGIDPDGALANPKGLALQVMPSANRLKEIM